MINMVGTCRCFATCWWWSINRHALLYLYHQTSNIRHLNGQWTCLSLRCSWSIACRHCTNYIFIIDLTSGFNGLSKENWKVRRETFKFWNWVYFILEVLQCFPWLQQTWYISNHGNDYEGLAGPCLPWGMISTTHTIPMLRNDRKIKNIFT